MPKRIGNQKLSPEIFAKLMQEFAQGESLNPLLKRYGLSSATFYRWRARYDGMSVQTISRVRNLDSKSEWDGRKLKQKDQEILALKAALRKKF